MTLAISIDTRHGGKPNFAMATITTIGDRTAVDFNYIRKPTVAEIACAEEAVTRFLKSNGEDITVVGSEHIPDPDKRRKALRKFLGGGQG